MTIVEHNDELATNPHFNVNLLTNFTEENFADIGKQVVSELKKSEEKIYIKLGDVVLKTKQIVIHGS